MSPTFRVALAVALLVFIDGQAIARKKPAPGPAPASACTDFYAIANQDWLLAHPLPASAGSLSRWDELNALAANQTAELLTRSGQRPAIAPHRVRSRPGRRATVPMGQPLPVRCGSAIRRSGLRPAR